VSVSRNTEISIKTFSGTSILFFCVKSRQKHCYFISAQLKGNNGDFSFISNVIPIWVFTGKGQTFLYNLRKILNKHRAVNSSVFALL